MPRSSRIPAIALVLFALSFAVRLSLISRGPFNVDCLKLALEAQETVSTGQLGHMFGTGYPLSVITGAAFVLIFGLLGVSDPVLAVNFMSVLFSSLAVFSYYFLVRELFGRTTALFAAIMLSVSPVFMGISVYGKSQPLNMFLLITGFTFLVLYRKSRSARMLLIGALWFGCAGANRLHEVALLFFPVTYLLLRKGLCSDGEERSQERWGLFIRFWSIVAVISVAGHLPYVLQEGREFYVAQLVKWYHDGFRGCFVFGYSPWFWNGIQYLALSLTWTGLVIAMGGLVLLLISNRPLLVFILLWIIFPYIFYSNSSVAVTPRYFVIILPPIIMALSHLLTYSPLRWKALRVVSFLVFLTIIHIVWTRIYPPLKIRHEHAYLPEFARWVGRNTPPEARIVTSDESLFIKHYGRREPLGRPLAVRPIRREELDQFKERVDALLEDGIPVYIYTISLETYDPGGYFARFVREQYRLTTIGSSLYEDWHRGEMEDSLYYIDLFRIMPK